MLTRQHSGVKVADSIPGPCRQDRRDRRDMHRRVGATARAGEGADPNDARPAEDVVRHRRRHARLPRGRGARAGGGLGQARQAIVNFGVLSRRSGLRRRRVCRSWRVSSSSLAPGAAPPLRSHARAFRHVRCHVHVSHVGMAFRSAHVRSTPARSDAQRDRRKRVALAVRSLCPSRSLLLRAALGARSSDPDPDRPDRRTPTPNLTPHAAGHAVRRKRISAEALPR